MLERAFRKIRARQLSEPEWISLRDGTFRAFFAIYFLISTFQWMLDHPLFPIHSIWGSCVSLFSDDLSAHSTGDVSYLAFDAVFLKSAPWRFLVMGLAIGASALTAQKRFRAWGICALLALGQLLGYSIGRRCISYDMIYIALLGYVAGLWFAARSRGRGEDTPVLAAIAAIASLYTLACIAKLSIAGFGWASPARLGQLLHYGRFRYFVGSSGYNPPELLVTYFSRPNLVSLVATASVLLVEGLAVLVILLGNFSWIYAWILIAAHVAMYFTVGILFHSCLGFFLLAGIPWNKLGPGRGAAFCASGRGFILKFCAVLLLLCWFLPTSPIRANVALVWPFSRFNMFGYGSAPISAYYFTDEKGALLEPSLVSHELRLNVASINSMIFGVFGMRPPRPEVADYLCKFVRAGSPEGGHLRIMPLAVRVRYIHAGPDGVWQDSDLAVKICANGTS